MIAVVLDGALLLPSEASVMTAARRSLCEMERSLLEHTLENLESLRRKVNLGLALGSLTVGVVVCAGLIWTKPAAPRLNRFDRAHDVSAVAIHPTTESIPVVGHGTVRAKKQVDLIPQVTGKLTKVHEDLAPGKMIPKGAVLFEIDRTVYEARVRQAKAEVTALEVAVLSHAQEATNLDARIANLEQMLTIEKDDYDTSKRLYDVDHVGSERDVDMAFQKYLRQKDVVVEFTNRRAMIPHVTAEAEAKLESARAKLDQFEHDLSGTEIRCPFDARVEAVSAYKSEVVTAHFSIATLTDMAAFEISVGIDPRELKWLADSIRPESLENLDPEKSPVVKVRWSLHGQDFSWAGRVSRFERVDEATRTARMVVEVQNADMVARLDGGAVTGQALSIGMFCTAELPAKALVEALLVPRHAVYDGRWVYVFEPDADSKDASVGRLGRREIPVLRSIGNDVLVDFADRGDGSLCELAANERVVVSPLSKPVIGMRVRLRGAAAVASVSPTLSDSNSSITDVLVSSSVALLGSASIHGGS